MKMKPYAVISLGSTRSETILDDPCVCGEFDSVKEAENWIREDAIDTADGTLESGRHPDWGSKHLIVKIVSSVIPIPSVKVTVKLKKETK